MISIITAHYNRARLIKDSIDSVLDQSYGNWEMIIVDDGSEIDEWDTVVDYIKKDKRIKLFKRTGLNKGPSACRNEGVAKSNGDYIVFLDSDDMLKSFCLRQRHEMMEAEKNITWAVFLIENFSKIPGDLGNSFNLVIPTEKLIEAFVTNNNPWQTMAPIWKKSFFTELGGFDESLLCMEDPDLHLRALRKNITLVKICYDKPADCFYRIHHSDNTKSNFYFNSIQYRILFYKKILNELSGKDFVKINKQPMREGIFNLIKSFVFSRRNEFPVLYYDLLQLMRESNLFSSLEVWKIKMLVDWGNMDSAILKKLKIKGICYKLLPKG